MENNLQRAANIVSAIAGLPCGDAMKTGGANMDNVSTPTTWQDPIVQELHVLRERLVEQYNGANV